MSDLNGTLTVLEQLTGTLSAPGQITGSLSSSGRLTGTLSASGHLTGTLSAPGSLSGTLSASAGITGALSIPEPDVPVYMGEYSFIPGDTAQVIHTRDYRLLDNITIAAIPNNYGKITWNGSVLTVS